MSHIMSKKYSAVNEVWRDNALCKEVGVDIFFADTEAGTKTQANKNKTAKEMCSKCKVQSACLSYALDNEINYGIWGGFTGRERNSIRTIFNDTKPYSIPLINTIINKTIPIIKSENIKTNS
jgi:hypothetical protein